jgi:hypothetical protein
LAIEPFFAPLMAAIRITTKTLFLFIFFKSKYFSLTIKMASAKRKKMQLQFLKMKQIGVRKKRAFLIATYFFSTPKNKLCLHKSPYIVSLHEKTLG